MSTDDSVRRRPTLWTYFSFSRPTTPDPRGRSISTSLPRPNSKYNDPYEKPDRHSDGSSNTVHSMMHTARNAWANQAQRGRLLKAGGLVFFVFCLYVFLHGSNVNLPAGQGKWFFFSFRKQTHQFLRSTENSNILTNILYRRL